MVWRRAVSVLSQTSAVCRGSPRQELHSFKRVGSNPAVSPSAAGVPALWCRCGFRLSIQPSLPRHLDVASDACPVGPCEHGVLAMMADLRSGFSTWPNLQTLFRWRQMLLTHDRSHQVVGGLRAHDEATQIVSGSLSQPTLHFETPPSAGARQEVQVLVGLFYRTAPNGAVSIAAMTPVSVGHLWFEIIRLLKTAMAALAGRWHRNHSHQASVNPD